MESPWATRFASSHLTLVHARPRSSARALWAALFVCAALSLAPRVARTQAAALSWQAPSECPDANVARQRAAELLPPSLRLPRSAVRIQRLGDGYQARVRVDGSDARRERVLTDASCLALTDAAVTVLVASSAYEPRADAVPPPWPPRSRPRSRHRVHARLYGAFLTHVGIAPHATAGAAVAASVGVDPLRLELRLQALGATETRSALGSRLEIGVVGAGLAACGGRSLGPVRASACLGLHVAALFVRARDVFDARSAVRLDPAPTVGLGVLWPRDARVALRLDVRAGLALARPRFRIDGDGELHRPAPLVAEALIGPELRF